MKKGLRRKQAFIEEPEPVEMDQGSDDEVEVEEGMEMDGGSSDDEVLNEAEFESEFEYFPFWDKDWHSVKQHCNRLLDKRGWDCGGLASSISEEEHEVGSAIKIGDRDSEAIGIGAVLNLKRYGGTSWAKSVQEFVLGHFSGEDRVRAESLLNRRVGLFVNERVLNVPPLLALQLHLSIFDEMQAHTRQARESQSEARYDLEYLLFITLGYRDASSLDAAKKRTGQMEWFHPEEEVYMQHSVCSVSWPISDSDMASRWTFDGRISQFKVIMFVPTTAIKQISTRFVQINEGQYE